MVHGRNGMAESSGVAGSKTVAPLQLMRWLVIR